MANEKTKTGLPKSTAAALSYVLGPVSGVVFFLLEKDPFIRFHAAQSIVVTTLLLFLWMVSGSIFLLWPIFQLITVLSFILWLMLIYRAWLGDKWEVPFVGKYTYMLVKKGEKVG